PPALSSSACASSGLEIPTSRKTFPKARTTGCIAFLLPFSVCLFFQSSASPPIILCVLAMNMTPSNLSLRRGNLIPAVLVGLYILLLASTLPTSARAQSPLPTPEKPAPDVIVFVNGDQLTGKLVRGVGDSVVFNSD